MYSEFRDPFTRVLPEVGSPLCVVLAVLPEGEVPEDGPADELAQNRITRGHENRSGVAPQRLKSEARKRRGIWKVAG